MRRAYRRLESSGESYSSAGPMHIPTSNYDHVEEEQRSYVFPSCGHVHGYHKSLQDRCTRALALELSPLPSPPLTFPLLSSPLLCCVITSNYSPFFLLLYNPISHHPTHSGRVLSAGKQVPSFLLPLPLNLLFATARALHMSSTRAVMWLHGVCARSGLTSSCTAQALSHMF